MTDKELIQYMVDNGIDYYIAEAWVEIGLVSDKATADTALSNYAF